MVQVGIQVTISRQQMNNHHPFAFPDFSHSYSVPDEGTTSTLRKTLHRYWLKYNIFYFCSDACFPLQLITHIL